LILATHPYGCRVLQRCLEYLPEEETSLFVDGLQKECESLVENQFGVRHLCCVSPSYLNENIL
jgi:hypothetical protein